MWFLDVPHLFLCADINLRLSLTLNSKIMEPKTEFNQENNSNKKKHFSTIYFQSLLITTI